jgi:hypothetical protein
VFVILPGLFKGHIYTRTGNFNRKITFRIKGSLLDFTSQAAVNGYTFLEGKSGVGIDIYFVIIGWLYFKVDQKAIAAFQAFLNKNGYLFLICHIKKCSAQTKEEGNRYSSLPLKSGANVGFLGLSAKLIFAPSAKRGLMK